MGNKPKVLFLCTHNAARSQKLRAFCAISAVGRLKCSVPEPSRRECIPWRYGR